MPVRLIQPYMDQAAGTLWWGAQQSDLIANGVADTLIERATDYAASTRIVTTATATMSSHADTYWMNSANPQTLTVPLTGYLPVGSVRSIIQKGAGAFTLAPATGVTFSTALSSLISKGINNIAQIVKDGPNSWTVFGGVGG